MRDTVPFFAVEGRAMIGLPPLESAAPRMKSTWPPKPLYGRVPMRIGADLPGEVDLECRVDGDHVVVAGHHERIVGVHDGVELEDRILVDEVEELLCAQNESRDDLTRMEGLARAVDDAGFDQGDHAVGEHLGMDAKVALVRRGTTERRPGCRRCRSGAWRRRG